MSVALCVGFVVSWTSGFYALGFVEFCSILRVKVRGFRGCRVSVFRRLGLFGQSVGIDGLGFRGGLGDASRPFGPLGVRNLVDWTCGGVDLEVAVGVVSFGSRFVFGV